MAKTDTLPADLPPRATPDTTPVPGGGSWAWDETTHSWVRSADSTQHLTE